MKLYEVNAEIEALLESLAPDPETGEVPANEDEIVARLHAMTERRMSILQEIARIALNNRAEADMLKKEEERLKARRTSLENKEKRLIHILDRECAGEKTDLGVATFSYRRANRLNVGDESAAIMWLRENNHPDCLRIPAPEVAKSEVAKLINSGIMVPGCSIVQEMTCRLK